MKNNLNNYRFSNTQTPYTNVRMGGVQISYKINNKSKKSTEVLV